MSVNTAALIMGARALLRERSTRTSGADLVSHLRATLYPVDAAVLTPDARRKLAEVHAVLEQLDDALDTALLERLDLLLLGLWIRVEMIASS